MRSEGLKCLLQFLFILLSYFIFGHYVLATSIVNSQLNLAMPLIVVGHNCYLSMTNLGTWADLRSTNLGTWAVWTATIRMHVFSVWSCGKLMHTPLSDCTFIQCLCSCLSVLFLLLFFAFNDTCSISNLDFNPALLLIASCFCSLLQSLEL